MTVLSDKDPVTFIATRDREKSKAFYGSTLGFSVRHEDGYATVFDLNGIMLRVIEVTNFTSQPFTVLGWKVDDMAATVKALAAAGVMFERFDGLQQDEFGIWSPGGNVKVAWFKDPDGNVLSVSNS